MEEINDSSYFQSTLSSEDSQLKEYLNNAILLSSNEEILSKSNDDIFYDTNEFSFSWNNNLTESDISDISDVEIYKSCSDLLEDNDNTSMFTLPSSKTYVKIISDKDKPDPAQNLNDAQNSTQEDYETNKSIPLKTILKRMFHEILGKYIKEPNTTCSISESNNNIEINNNDSFCQLSGSNHACSTSETIRNVTLPSDDTSVDVSNKFCYAQLETILEQSNENCDTSDQQPPLDFSEKYIRKLSNFASRKFNTHLISDKILIIGDADESTSSESNASCDIEMLSMEIFKKLNDLQNNHLVNSIDWNSNNFNINNILINNNNTNNEEYNLVKSKRLKTPPIILITPASPI